MRENYSDDDEVLFDVMRPVLLNGIEELSTRSLINIAILLHLILLHQIVLPCLRLFRVVGCRHGHAEDS